MNNKMLNDLSASESSNSLTASAETRTLRDVVYSSKNKGGNYGSLAKSQIQPVFYVLHKIQSDDTMRRLALKYNINIQDIKRVNKLWSDAELVSLENVYIPINSLQLNVLRTNDPAIEIVHHLPSSTITTKDDETSSVHSFTMTNTSSCQDYFSKIDQQIQMTKNSLQSMDNQSPSIKFLSNQQRHKDAHHLSDNSVYVNVKSKNSSAEL